MTVDGKPAGASPLLATKAVAAASTLDKITSILFNPLVLVPLGLIVLLAGIWLARREGGPHRPHIHFPSVDRKSLPKVSLPKREPKSPRTAADRERMRDERMRRRAEQSRSREE